MQSCNDYIVDSQNESGFGSGGVNIYDIFADVCGAEQEVTEVRQFARVLGRTDAAHAQVEASSGDVAARPAWQPPFGCPRQVLPQLGCCTASCLALHVSLLNVPVVLEGGVTASCLGLCRDWSLQQ